MSEMKTFSGKNVDEAMEQACQFFKTEREKLEIEIITGGSTGIFGLVGKKKAEIRARVREEIRLLAEPSAPAPTAPAPLADAPETGLEAAPEAASAPEARPVARQPARPAKLQDAAAPQTGDEAAAPAAFEPAQESAAAAKTSPAAEDRPAAERRRPRQGAPRQSGGRAAREQREPRETREPREPRETREPREPREPRETREPREPRETREPREPREALPPPGPLSEELTALVREVMEHLLTGILDALPEMEISGNSERVTVLVLDEENSGLLIGREGQTLASLQYLANRIVARRHEDPVRIQINTGEYRERQDDNLRKMAIYLADKAKSLGRPQSTKPLSSYHRRVVHLALQEDETVQTRSKGDGPLKRVIIVPRQQRNGGSAERAG